MAIFVSASGSSESQNSGMASELKVNIGWNKEYQGSIWSFKNHTWLKLLLSKKLARVELSCKAILSEAVTKN